MDTNEIMWVRDAVHCLTEYQKYGEEMRKVGKGFHPMGLMGHSIESVILALSEMAERQTVADTLAEMDANTR